MLSPPRVYGITFTVPAGTTQTAPFKQTWKTEDNTIVDIELEVPPGHNGVTGIRVVKGDTQLVPWGTDTWIVANDYSRIFPVGVYLPTGDVVLQGYNNGAYPHSFYLRMMVISYDQASRNALPSESGALPVTTPGPAADPLSPDALLGPDTVAALLNGTVTADQIAPISPSDLIVSVPSMPAG